MSLLPPPPAPYTDFANQYQEGRPGVLPTGGINIPQTQISPPNGGFGLPNQMQSGLNANQYTAQTRILDVEDNRSGSMKPNSGALSQLPWTTLQPYSLICVGGTDLYWSMSRGVNPNERPMKGCVLNHLLDRPGSNETKYTAFERAVNPSADDANVPLTTQVAPMANSSVGRMVKTGLFLPNGDLSDFKNMLSAKDMQAALATMRVALGELLDETNFFDKFQPDSSVNWTSMGDEHNKEIDEASGFATFGTRSQGHAYVAECTTKLKCHVFDTVYVVIRAIATGVDGKIDLKHPEMCLLTSRQLKKASEKAGGNMDNLGDKLRGFMANVDREDSNKYVILGGWKLGKVVDIHGIPAASHKNMTIAKGTSFYEIMLNIERCTALELLRHAM